MLTKAEFFNRYKGTAIDYDGAAGVQCVDLIKFYLRDCFGIRAGSWGNARVYFERFNDPEWDGHSSMTAKFDKIANTPDFIPQRGDICVFGKGVGGGAGHISIADGVGTTSYFYSYDTNWNGKACKRVKHRYTSEDFLGVLRPNCGAITELANIREGAGVSYEVIDEIAAGKLVRKIKTLGKWTLTERGWIYSSLID